jgi:PncC family amidohydrolase
MTIILNKIKGLMTTIEEKIHFGFIEKGLTLSLAESCTGGFLTARLTPLAGCSQYFLGSVVAYSNHVKINVLGVDKTLLGEQGAVSKGVVGEMADGIIRLTGSDYSIAVSGVAGPGGGNEQKPVGTICAAIGRKGRSPVTWSFQLTGERVEIMDRAVDVLLDRLYASLQE